MQVQTRTRESREPQTDLPTPSGSRERDPAETRDAQDRSSKGSPSAKALSPSSDVLVPIDRTERAVSRQLAAMGLERFDIGVRDAQTGHLERRTWSHEEVLENLAWLKHRNARGAEIQVRPAPEVDGPSLVLLDGLSRTALRTLEREGRAPAIVVEYSHNVGEVARLEPASLGDLQLVGRPRGAAADELRRR